MNRLLRALRAPRGEDEGAGLLLVIGTAGVVMSLVLVAASIAERSLTSGRQHDAFTTALQAAESGIDLGLARVQGAYDLDASDYRTPHPSATDFDQLPDCVGAEVTFPSTAGASAAAETAWAKAQLLAVAGISGCVRTIARGEYVVLKPAGRQAVYAMGWSPSRTAPKPRMRMLKAEYIFAPYKPSNAVLTGGDLELNASTLVTGATAGGVDQAAVHSNGNITVTNGNPTVTGPVTYSGGGSPPQSNNFPGGQGSASAAQSVPTISARSVYRRNVANYVGAWFDLCPDGKARAGSTSGVECTGTVLGDYAATGSGTFKNGWTFTAGVSGGPPTWSFSPGDDSVTGIFYVSQGNAATGQANKSSSKLTVIASSVGTSCNKSGGNIDWDKVNIATPYLTGTFMIADQDLRTGSNFGAGSASGSTVISGLFVGGDQVELQTSSNGAFGSVIAGDQCDPTGSMVDKNVIKNPEVYYDPTGYAPFTDVVNTTLWLEMTG